MSVETIAKEYWEAQVPDITKCYMNTVNEVPVEPYMVQKLVSKNDAGYGTTEMRLQLDIFTKDPEGFDTAKGIAQSLTTAIRSLMEDNIFASYRANEIEDFENLPGKYRATVDALIYYDETSIFS